MGDVLRKYFKYQNFPTYVRLSLFLECFWRNLTKIGQIYIPYKFAQRGCIPSKIKC